MPSKSESDHIILLLAIIAQSKETDWNAVAETTGLYKSGKFVKQALDSIKKKYARDSGALPTPKSTEANGSTKKRRAVAEESGDEVATPSKKSRTNKVKDEDVKEEVEHEPLKLVEDSD